MGELEVFIVHSCIGIHIYRCDKLHTTTIEYGGIFPNYFEIPSSTRTCACEISTYYIIENSTCAQ